VDSDLFESSDAALDRESCRRLLGISADRFVLLFSGKLIPRKNVLLVLKALEQTPERGRVTFVVLGDGPERSRLEQEGKRLLGENFVLAGFKNQSQLAPYFKAADALALPSHYETWGLVVNEAMHFGLPVVVSDTAGCAADLVENRETGILFRSNDAADLVQALRRIIGNDSLRGKFSRNARRIIRAYTPDNAAKGILEYCSRLKRSPRVYSSRSARAEAGSRPKEPC
jgi:glycosyltransferase involved in cell wall biosynthesis